jgi:hypothetical protein
LRQNGDRDVLEEEKTDEEEEEEDDDKTIELWWLILDLGAVEEEQQDSERLVLVVGQRLTEIHKVISVGQEWLLGRKERVAAGGRLGGYSAGHISRPPEWYWLGPAQLDFKIRGRKPIFYLRCIHVPPDGVSIWKQLRKHVVSPITVLGRLRCLNLVLFI